MAQAKFIQALIRAHLSKDDNAFRRVAMQIAAMESSAGHNNIAREIRDCFDKHVPTFGQSVLEKKDRSLDSYDQRANASALLHASYCKESLRDMVLDDNTYNSIASVIGEWKHQELLEINGLSKKNKILLVGPPGCGKTMTAKVFAGELGMPLFVVKLETLISRFLGETSSNIKEVFNSMYNTPGVYLFDEFDSIGTTRSDMRDIGEIRRVLSTFLLLLEGFNGNSLIIAATNYDEILDMALFRRFDDVIRYPMPQKVDIISLLKLKLYSFTKKGIDIGALADLCQGMSYAEINKSVVEAFKSALFKNKGVVTNELLIEAIKYRKKMNPSTIKQ